MGLTVANEKAMAKALSSMALEMFKVIFSTLCFRKVLPQKFERKILAKNYYF